MWLEDHFENFRDQNSEVKKSLEKHLREITEFDESAQENNGRRWLSIMPLHSFFVTVLLRNNGHASLYKF